MRGAALKAGVASVADGPLPIGEIIGAGLAIWDLGKATHDIYRMKKSVRRISKLFQDEINKIYSSLSPELLKGKRDECCNQFTIDISGAVGTALGSYGKSFPRELKKAFTGLKNCCNPVQKVPHGNKLGDQLAYRYKKYNKDGNFLKHGITQDPKRRYPPESYYDSKGRYVEGMDGGELVIVDSGPRNKIAQDERIEVETNPGPNNREPWAGRSQ